MKKLKPIQKYLLNTLSELIPFLEKNKINYFACGGTMIGAIREKGFIEWDDDIDLFIPRPDYDRLIELAKEVDFKLTDNLTFASGDTGNLLVPFAKVFDERYEVNDLGYEGEETKLYIDIFPFDAVPDSKEEALAFYKKIEKKRKLMIINRYSYKNLFKVTNNKLTFPIKAIYKLYSDIKGPKNVMRSYINYCKKYDFNAHENTFDTVWGKMIYVKLKKDDIKTIKMPFENMKINVMKGYDNYLTPIFGDYMTPPKKKDRECHNLKITEVKNGK